MKSVTSEDAYLYIHSETKTPNTESISTKNLNSKIMDHLQKSGIKVDLFSVKCYLQSKNCDARENRDMVFTTVSGVHPAREVRRHTWDQENGLVPLLKTTNTVKCIKQPFELNN